LARTLILGIWRSDFLDVGTKAVIHNNGLQGEGTVEHFYLDVGRIIGNFHFPLFQWELWALISPVMEGTNFLFWGGSTFSAFSLFVAQQEGHLA